MTSRRPCWCPKPILWEFNSFLMQTLSVVPINLHRCWPREWKHSINNLRVLHKTRTHSTHALIFGAPRWIAVVTGNIHMKTSQEQKISCEPFIRAVLVLDKTCSYKWYRCVLCKTQLIFLRINGPYVYIYIVSHQIMTHSFNIKASFWKIYFILKLLYTSSKSKLIYSHLPLGDFS